jgi:hypothetical protein
LHNNTSCPKQALCELKSKWNSYKKRFDWKANNNQGSVNSVSGNSDLYDLIIVTLRLDQLDSVMPTLNDNHVSSLVMFMLNNPDNIETLKNELKQKHFIAKSGMQIIAKKALTIVHSSCFPTPTLDRLLPHLYLLNEILFKKNIHNPFYVQLINTLERG